ncbi:hypothetical protein CONLIGDRAFT_26387 [Coniochaeta ligniaria NRRL 30616]|uniref:Uncharacterized protein n=1 Tax=Coniochaeta ligniaria NRRL 30616 TaxID=1408157 RepID=A0A1J7JZE1_9PEZI|nr:hypothetical protein CONLIGDRAFT_26387 [Coniochaeta ligniaria NRRL 30616]
MPLMSTGKRSTARFQLDSQPPTTNSRSHSYPQTTVAAGSCAYAALLCSKYPVSNGGVPPVITVVARRSLANQRTALLPGQLHAVQWEWLRRDGRPEDARSGTRPASHSAGTVLRWHSWPQSGVWCWSHRF